MSVCLGNVISGELVEEFQIAEIGPGIVQKPRPYLLQGAGFHVGEFVIRDVDVLRQKGNGVRIYTDDAVVVEIEVQDGPVDGAGVHLDERVAGKRDFLRGYLKRQVFQDVQLTVADRHVTSSGCHQFDGIGLHPGNFYLEAEKILVRRRKLNLT